MEEPGADLSHGSPLAMEWSGEGRRSAPALQKSQMKKSLQVMKFGGTSVGDASCITRAAKIIVNAAKEFRSEEHTSELQSLTNLVCRLLLEKKKKKKKKKKQTNKKQIVTRKNR